MSVQVLVLFFRVCTYAPSHNRAAYPMTLPFQDATLHLKHSDKTGHEQLDSNLDSKFMLAKAFMECTTVERSTVVRQRRADYIFSCDLIPSCETFLLAKQEKFTRSAVVQHKGRICASPNKGSCDETNASACSFYSCIHFASQIGKSSMCVFLDHSSGCQCTTTGR